MNRAARWNAAALGLVAVAGASVLVTGTLAAAEDYACMKNSNEMIDHSLPNETSDTSENEISLQGFPATRAEFLAAYSANRDALGKVFRIVGQMLIAPIVMVAIDKVNDHYGNPLGF